MNQKIPTVYMLCAIPGAGKTTYAKQYLIPKNPTIVYLSSDDIRQELFGDASIQDKNDLVFKTLFARARIAILGKRDVILDATHLTKENRKKTRENFKDLNCCFIAIEMATPIEDCKIRNLNRTRVVPEYAMDRMIKNFEQVLPQEGFKEIWVIKDGKKSIRH